MDSTRALARAACVLAFALLAGCGTPHAFVVLDNDYPASATAPLVIYRARWQAIAFQTPVPPGSSSDAQSTVPASDNTAYAVLAPGWDPASAAPPTSFVVLQSQGGFGVHLDNTLHIPVSDVAFTGNCAAGNPLTQAQADFITQLVFPDVFAGAHYNAATCTTTPAGEGGAP